jgi:hypothetical protein
VRYALKPAMAKQGPMMRGRKTRPIIRKMAGMVDVGYAGAVSSAKLRFGLV